MKHLIHIALSFDANFRFFAAACMQSVLSNASPADSFVFHLLTDGLTGEDKEFFLSMGQTEISTINLIDFTSDNRTAIPKTLGSGRYADSAYFRTFLAGYLSEVERVLYLDADVIVLESLWPLYATDLEGAVIGAVPDFGYYPAWPEERAKRLGLNVVEGDKRYFNSGVLLMDLNAWRRKNITCKVLEVSREFASIIDSQDQDALNILFYNDYKELDMQWNVTIPIYEKASRISILHVTGPTNKFTSILSRYLIFYLAKTRLSFFPLQYIYTNNSKEDLQNKYESFFESANGRLKSAIDNLIKNNAADPYTYVKAYQNSFQDSFNTYWQSFGGKKIYFFGCGKAYHDTKYLFAHACPRGILLTSEFAADSSRTIDGIPVFDLAMAPSEAYTMPIIIFSRPEYVYQIQNALVAHGFSPEYIEVLFDDTHLFQ